MPQSVCQEDCMIVKILIDTLLQPTDVIEWQAVTEEARRFLEIDSPIPSDEGSGGHGYTLNPRCTIESPLAGNSLTHVYVSWSRLDITK